MQMRKVAPLKQFRGIEGESIVLLIVVMLTLKKAHNGDFFLLFFLKKKQKINNSYLAVKANFRQLRGETSFTLCYSLRYLFFDQKAPSWVLNPD